MSKRSHKDIHNVQHSDLKDNDKENSQHNLHFKKTKLNQHAISSNLLNNLPKDEFTHMITFLQIGQVIMLSLSCKSIYNFLNEHLKILYPYFTPIFKKHNKNVNLLEWSIGRALQTNRKLLVLSGQVEKLFDTLIERKEPFEKLTRTVYAAKYSVDVYDVLDLFSKLTGQRRENVKFVTLSYELPGEDDEEPSFEECRKEAPISVRDVSSVPIGFHVKDFILDMNVSLSNFYSILSQCYALEKLKLSLDEDSQVEFSIQVPMLENLKYLEVRTEYGYGSLEQKLIYDLVKLAPNLEYLDIVYGNLAPSDDFLLYLTEKCPNLKGISIDIEEYTHGLTYTDQFIEKFLKAAPRLEYLNFGHYCNNISGEILTKIGQFSNLRYININRGKHSENLVAQYNDLHFGGGVLNNLEYISLGKRFSLKNATQSEKDKFITSLMEMAPNIKDIDTLSTIDGINIFDYMDKLAPLLIGLPRLSSEIGNDSEHQIELWLKKAKRLEEIVWEYNADISNLEPIPSVKKLTIERKSSILDQLSRVFPSITELNFNDDYGYDHTEFIEVLKQGKWPDLKLFNGFSSLENSEKQTLLGVRPNICRTGPEDFPFILDDKVQFVNQWLTDVVEDTSKMRQFANK